jgi:hypothetical protein
VDGYATVQVSREKGGLRCVWKHSHLTDFWGFAKSDVKAGKERDREVSSGVTSSSVDS